MPLPPATMPGRVQLRVSSLDRALDFYRGLLGFVDVARDADRALLAPTADAAPVLALREVPGIRHRGEGTAGLYHVAVLLPDRRDLGRVLLRLFERRWAFQGFADHGVSEAAYLTDPDGNGLELAADRPRDAWPRAEDGSLLMYTHTLNVTALLRLIDGDPWLGLPETTRIGHVHLHVEDLTAAERFWSGVIGLDVTTRRYPGALFMAAGAYHHHLAVNTWARGRPRPADSEVAGLDWFELIVPAGPGRDALLARVAAADAVAEPAVDGTRVADPEGNVVVIG